MWGYRLSSFILAVAVSTNGFSAVRVFVSRSGVDSGTCSVSSPCRNFAYAVTQVSPGGEVVALDTAGYGPLTITMSMSIVAAPGALAFIAAPSAQAVWINAAPTDIVVLRGLAINSTGAGNGIVVQSNSVVNIENCIINGFSGGISAGIHVTTSSPSSQINILNSTLRSNYIAIWADGAVMMTISNCALTGNVADGLAVYGNSRVSVSESVFAGNYSGVSASSGTDTETARVSLERCSLSHNTTGILAGDGAPNVQWVRGIIRAANCTITDNVTGIWTETNGATLSRSAAGGVTTNTVTSNDTDGSFSGTFAAQ